MGACCENLAKGVAWCVTRQPTNFVAMAATQEGLVVEWLCLWNHTLGAIDTGESGEMEDCNGFPSIGE
jgi:hypothetical protein